MSVEVTPGSESSVKPSVKPSVDSGAAEAGVRSGAGSSGGPSAQSDVESTAGPSPAVVLEVESGVARITLNRPEARNMLTTQGMSLLASLLRAAGADPDVRVIVLTGSGNTFCSGADLRGASAAEAGTFRDSGPGALVDALEAMLDNPKPIIARVQGHVAGGGNGLVAAADLSVATRSAKFAFSEVRLGLAPAVISVVCLARMSRHHAQELLLTGDRVSADRVAESGLINRAVDDSDLDAAVQGWVDSLQAGGPEALAHTKDLLRIVPGLPRDEAFAHTARLSAQIFGSGEAAAGMMAFLSRSRAPWAPQP